MKRLGWMAAGRGLLNGCGEEAGAGMEWEAFLGQRAVVLGMFCLFSRRAPPCRDLPRCLMDSDVDDFGALDSDGEDHFCALPC